MKKGILAVAIFLLSVLLVSCPVPYSFMHGEPDLDTIRVDIVKLETVMGYHVGDPYNEENVSVIKVIETDKIEAFLSDFKKIKSYQPLFGSRIDYVSGVAIRITYANGDVELITRYGTATVSNEKILIHTTTFDSDAFSEFIAKYS